MLIYQACKYILTKFTLHVIHTSHNTQPSHNLGPIQQGTSRPLRKHEPYFFQSSIQHQTTRQPRNFLFPIQTPSHHSLRLCGTGHRNPLILQSQVFETKPYGLSWPPIYSHTIPNTIAYNMSCDGHVISRVFTSTQPCNLHTW